MKRCFIIMALSCQAFAACGGASPTWTAASSSQTDVQACFNQTLACGDTIIVPAGTSTWSTTMSTSNFPSSCAANTGITVQGATTVSPSTPGSSPTSAVDNTNITLGGLQIINYTTAANTAFVRFTGFTFIPGSVQSNGLFQIYGTARDVAYRLDHLHIKSTQTGGFLFSIISVYGLSDHILLEDTTVTAPPIVPYAFYGDYLRTSGFTDWQQATGFGTNQAEYIEDSTFNYAASGQASSEGIFDSYSGAKIVLRYSTMKNIIPGGNHGYDSNLSRGVIMQSFEHLTMDNTTGSSIFLPNWRSGTGVFHDNVVNNSGGGGWNSINLAIYRISSVANVGSFGTSGTGLQWEVIGANGIVNTLNAANYQTSHTYAANAVVGPTSGNAGNYNFQTTAGGTSGGSAPTWPQTIGNTVTDSGGVVWTNVGGSTSVGTEKFDSVNPDNQCTSGGTCTYFVDGLGSGSGCPARDQPGRGHNQVLTPIYAWNNSGAGLPGTLIQVVDGATTCLTSGTDYYPNTAMPSYTPYTYPNPLQGVALITTSVGWTWANVPGPNSSVCKYVGLGLVDMSAGGAHNATVCQKYGGTFAGSCSNTGDNNWAQAQSARLQNLGFNVADWYSYNYYAHYPANGIPYVQSVPTSGYAMRDTGDDSVTGSPWHVKDTLNIPNTSTMKCGAQIYRGSGSVDPYDPNYSSAVTNMMAALGSAAHGYSSQANAMATIADETDNMVCFEEANNPNYAHADCGYVIAAQSPTQATSPSWAGGGFSYTDHEFYAKQAMRDFLKTKYSNSISSLNSAWGTSYTTFDTSDAGGLAGITSGTYASWGTGTGFLDEAGNGIFNTNVSTNPNQCNGANGNGPTQGLDAWGKNAQIKIDADAFFYALTAKYASVLRTAYLAGCGSTCPPEIIPIYDGPYTPSTASVYTAAAPYVDVFMVAPFAYTSVSAVQTEVQNIINNDGGAPIIYENYLSVQPDSTEGGTCTASSFQDCQTTQALRGSLWTNLNNAVLRLKNPNGKYAVVGFSHWLQYADALAQELFTANDNAYDGSQASTLSSASACATSHSYTAPAICSDPNGNFESLRVSSCTSGGSAPTWPALANNANPATLQVQTTDGTCKWFNIGSYALIAESSNFGNSLGPIRDFQTGNLCDSAAVPLGAAFGTTIGIGTNIGIH